MQVLYIVTDSGLGVSVCDRLQCVCDRTTAECMAASHFNHPGTSQCSGPWPPCMRRPCPPPQLTNADSSQESSETTKSDLQTHTQLQEHPHSKPGHTKPAGGAREQEGKDIGNPDAEEDEEEEEEEEGGRQSRRGRRRRRRRKNLEMSQNHILKRL